MTRRGSGFLIRSKLRGNRDKRRPRRSDSPVRQVRRSRTNRRLPPACRTESPTYVSLRRAWKSLVREDFWHVLADAPDYVLHAVTTEKQSESAAPDASQLRRRSPDQW